MEKAQGIGGIYGVLRKCMPDIPNYKGEFQSICDYELGDCEYSYAYGEVIEEGNEVYIPIIDEKGNKYSAIINKGYDAPKVIRIKASSENSFQKIITLCHMDLGRSHDLGFNASIITLNDDELVVDDIVGIGKNQCVFSTKVYDCTELDNNEKSFISASMNEFNENGVRGLLESHKKVANIKISMDKEEGTNSINNVQLLYDAGSLENYSISKSFSDRESFSVYKDIVNHIIQTKINDTTQKHR